MSARRFIALALATVLALGMAAPAWAAEPAAEAEILWLPDGLTIPTELVTDYIPEFNWLNVYRDKWGDTPCVYDLSTGKVVEEYDRIQPFSEGLAAVSKDGKTGYIDLDGKLCIPMTWDIGCEFHDGVALTMLTEEWREGCIDYIYTEHYLIDREGNVLAKLDEDAAQEYVDSQEYTPKLWSAHKNGTWLLLDENGQVVRTLDEDYDTVGSFYGGLALVWREGKCGYIDRMGREVVPCQYDYGDIITEGADSSLNIRYYYVQDGLRIGLLENPDRNNEGPGDQTVEPATATAYPSTQMVEVDGKPTQFQMYALKDANGNDTNYVKLRDLAAVLDRFGVGWDGSAVTVWTDRGYLPNGTEGKTPYSGPQTCSPRYARVSIDWQEEFLDALLITDDKGGGYTYFRLRDLGEALGFNVGWNGERGVYIETDKPYMGE